MFLVASHTRPCLLHPHSLNAQVQTFGLSLTQLDIRQESTRHAEVRMCGGGGAEWKGCVMLCPGGGKAVIGHWNGSILVRGVEA